MRTGTQDVVLNAVQNGQATASTVAARRFFDVEAVGGRVDPTPVYVFRPIGS